MSDWQQLARGLTSEFRDLPAGAVVVISESSPQRQARYVQFEQTTDRVEAELVSNPWLDAEARASAAGLAVIEDLGWAPEDDAHHLWWTSLSWPATSADHRRLADMIVRGLRDGYGIGQPDDLSYRAWNDLDGTPLLLPQLGLPRTATR